MPIINSIIAKSTIPSTIKFTIYFRINFSPKDRRVLLVIILSALKYRLSSSSCLQ